jgi:hypothetical protein
MIVSLVDDTVRLRDVPYHQITVSIRSMDVPKSTKSVLLLRIDVVKVLTTLSWTRKIPTDTSLFRSTVCLPYRIGVPTTWRTEGEPPCSKILIISKAKTLSPRPGIAADWPVSSVSGGDRAAARRDGRPIWPGLGLICPAHSTGTLGLKHPKGLPTVAGLNGNTYPVFGNVYLEIAGARGMVKGVHWIGVPIRRVSVFFHT